MSTSQHLMPVSDFPARARRHRWDPHNVKSIAACDSPDGNDRTERTCEICKIVKITVHYPSGYPAREWRTADGKPWWGGATPPCVDKVTA